jgi:nucleoside-diphosphate-sugar epimerase
MKILFTGASSFTGFWFVKRLAAAGHEVVCPITRDLPDYTGTRRQRLDLLKPSCRFAVRAPFGSENFLNLVRTLPFDLLCHHAAVVVNYKSADFDACAALRENTMNLRDSLAAMKPRDLKAVVLTGTYFEPDEGSGDEPSRAFSPYSLSKAMTFQFFRHYCWEAGVALGKFVIPNPFGPFEEPRFTSLLMRNWKAGQPVEIKTPDYVRDNIHVDLLAAVYAQFAARMATEPGGLARINPSGYAEKQGVFAGRVAREVNSRTGWTCEFKLAPQTDFIEPLNRINTEPAVKNYPHWSEQKAWDAFTEFYSNDISVTQKV